VGDNKLSYPLSRSDGQSHMKLLSIVNLKKYSVLGTFVIFACITHLMQSVLRQQYQVSRPFSYVVSLPLETTENHTQSKHFNKAHACSTFHPSLPSSLKERRGGYCRFIKLSAVHARERLAEKESSSRGNPYIVTQSPSSVFFNIN
jgi:hypothetical protein